MKRKLTSMIGACALLLSVPAGSVYAKAKTPQFTAHVEAFVIVSNISQNNDSTYNLNGIFDTANGLGKDTFDSGLIMNGLSNQNHIVTEYLYAPSGKQIDSDKDGFYGTGRVSEVTWRNEPLSRSGTYTIKCFVDGHYVAYCTLIEKG